MTVTTGDSGARGEGTVPEPHNVEARLKVELTRLEGADSFEALQLGYDADRAQVRARFLSVTKEFHPSRFARMDRAVVRTANEVFLRLKDAYSELSDDEKRERLRATRVPAAPVSARASARASTRTGVRASTRTSAGASTGDKAREESGSQRGAAVDAPTQRGVAVQSPTTATNRRPMTRPKPVGPRVGRPPSTRIPRSPVTERGPAGTGARPAITDASKVNASLQDTVRKRNETYERALKLSSVGRYDEARKLFHQIAADDPKTKKYRLQLHYTWGLEHEDAGRIDEARAEFQRAVQVDPAFKRAHEALDRLPGDKKGGGLFSKIFRR